MKFTHLHVHTHYSLLDGLPQIKPLVSRAKELGMDSLAITDHGTMYGVIDFYKTCNSQGIKPIIGVETYVALDKLTQKRPGIDKRQSHLVLLAKTFEGYKNLLKLVSIAHMEGFYYKPRIDHELLRKHSSGLIGLSACLGGEIPRSILYKRPEETEKLIAEYVDIFGEGNFYLELQSNPGLDKQVLVNEKLIGYSRSMGIPLVATNDIHYLKESDKDAQDILTCISTGKLVTDTNRMKMTDLDCSMKTGEEMLGYFKDTPEAISNTRKIADMCDVEIPLGKFYFPNMKMPEGRTDDEVLYENIFKGLAWRYKLPDYEKLSETEIRKQLDQMDTYIVERAEYEYGIIKTKGYSAYFLIVADFAVWSANQGINTTTRGSAAGSLVSYSLRIININPLVYKLPFERFLNPFRDSAPDIDIDIEESRRHEVIDYVVKKYGKDHVAQIITFGSMLAKAAVRDVGRALGMPYSVPDRISKMIPLGSQGFAMTIERAKDENPELAMAYEREQDTKTLLDLAEKVEGCARHASVHAAGVVISPTPLTDFCPLQESSDGVVTQYDMHAVEDVGLVKMDFLGLRNLSMIGKAVQIIKQTKNIDIDIYDIPLDDKKTFEMLSKGLTYGVFQLSGGGMTKYLMELKPERIHDIMAMVALYRPGPMNSIPEYIRRKRNPKLVTYPDPRMTKILEMSYGILTYQDDVLLTAIEVAGYTWGEADKLRKAMGKKIVAEMERQKDKFLKGAVERGLTLAKAKSIFQLIEPFAAYGFNKAHACSYGTVAYQTAYLKANYTAEYMSAYLTCESGDSDKVAEAIAECQKMGIEVLPPDVNESLADFTAINDKQIRFGFLAIKNIGEGIVEAIITERKAEGEYKSLEDFVVRVRDKSFNKKNLESLAKSGCLDRFIERTQVIESVDVILNYAREQHRAYEAGQSSLFGGADAGVSALLGLKVAEVEPVTLKTRLAWEKELLGVYLTEHPYTAFEKKLEKFIIPLSRIIELNNEDKLYTAGIVSQVKQITTKKGELMAFLMVADTRTSKEVIVFPKTFNRYRSVLEGDKIVLVDGNISDKDGEKKVIARALYELDEETVEAICLKLKSKSLKDFGTNGALKKIIPSFDKNSRQVILSVKYPLNEDLTKALKEIFNANKGNLKVFLNVFTLSESKLIETTYSVDLTPQCLKDLRNCQGLKAIQIR